MTLLAIALVFVAVVLLPGVAIGVATTSPDDFGRVRTGVLGARSLASGVSVWLLVAGLLVRTVGLTPTSARVAAVVVAASAMVAIALPRHRAVLRAAGGEAAYIGGLGALALVSWLPVGALMWGTTTGTIGSTPWFYWGLARQIVAAQGFPETSVEFATTVPYLADYPLFSSGTAMVMTGFPEAAQPAVLTMITMLAVVCLGVGAAVLARTWGAGLAASFVAVPLAVSLGVGGYRLLGYRPEGFGLGLSLLAVALFVHWFRERDRTSLVVGCVLGAVVSQVHGVAFAVMSMFLVAAAVTVFATIDTSWRFVRTALVSVVPLGLTVLAFGLLMGRVSGSETSGGIVEGAAADDPTWLFRRVARGHDPTDPPSAATMLSDGLERLVEIQPTLVWAAVVGGAVVVILRARRARSHLAPLVFLVVGGLLILAVALVFLLGWDSYVPRRTGTQRVLLESSLLVPVFLAGALTAATDLAAVATRARLRAGVIAVAVAAAVAAGFTASRDSVADPSDLRPRVQDHRALSSLDLPSDAVVLANGYTEGYVRQLTGGRALLEGRAPYTFPELLTRSLDLLGDAREFYRHPRDNLDFLDRNGVTHVAISRRGSFSLAIKTPFPAGHAALRLQNSPHFAQIVASPGLLVFKYNPEH